MSHIEVDVAIIGGGPAGSTCGSLLRKYNPDLNVAIFERERFPREHVGESQLPPISGILEEMGCWDKIEAANFPIKIGATYRWGSSEKLWDFEFVPVREFKNPHRPGTLEGQRRFLAFQVDRAIYDDILLRHAESLGCTVHEEAKVVEVVRDGDRVVELRLASGQIVRAKHYVDASGGTGILRRAMGVEIDTPTKLQNIAFWDYWENTKWAVRYHETATRVLVLSIGSGWLWYIPLGPTTTSIGFICPATFHKESGRTPAEQYKWALSQEPLVTDLIQGGTSTGEIRATKDWSFVSDRMVGENWFLAGESCGFADPILAAGLTLTHLSAKEAAYTILDIERGATDGPWLKDQYEQNQSKRIRQHIRFADFWYSANGIFTDLQAFTQEIAADAGLELEPAKAFQWLGTGGFTDDFLGRVGVAGFDLSSARHVMSRFLDTEVRWQLSKYNVLKLNLEGATESTVPLYADGIIERRKCYLRGPKRLPRVGLFATLVELLESHKHLDRLIAAMEKRFKPGTELHGHALQVLETMIQDGWIKASLDPMRPRATVTTKQEGKFIHNNRELNEQIESLSGDVPK